MNLNRRAAEMAFTLPNEPRLGQVPDELREALWRAKPGEVLTCPRVSLYQMQRILAAWKANHEVCQTLVLKGQDTDKGCICYKEVMK